MNRDDTLEAYLAAGQRWDADIIARAERSRDRAYWVAAGFGLLAALALVALAGLTPLKSVQPYVIRVDSSSGVVDVVPTYAGKSELPDLVTRHLLHSYVVARESYFYAMAERDYNVVGAYQSAPLNAKWLEVWDRNNPDSPLVKYKDGTTVRAQVNSISFLQRADGTRDLAQVRFYTATRIGGVGNEHLQHWISTLQYAFAEPSKDEQIRVLNPMGFRIVDYRREPEIVSEPATSATAGQGARE